MPRPAREDELRTVFENDINFAAERDAHYEASWKARGGPGAFFTIVRPWDRFEAIAKRGVGSKSYYRTPAGATSNPNLEPVAPFDLFAIIQTEIDAGKTENDDGTLQACIRDLRIYMGLLAVEAQRMRQVYASRELRRQEGPRDTVAKQTQDVAKFNPED